MQKFNKNLIIATISGAILIGLILFSIFRDKSELIDYNLYQKLLENSVISKAIIDKDYVYLYAINQKYKIARESLDLKEVYKNMPVEVDNASELTSSIIDVIILSILLFFVVMLLRTLKKEKDFEQEKKKQQEQFKNSLAGIQKKASMIEGDEFSQLIKPSISSVTFKDVAGIIEVKEELEEIIDFLKNPIKYKEFGIKLPKGVLLIGPPGVGKTLIAKAVAGEAGVPFFYQSGASFVQIYVGVGAKRVRELFAKAKAMAPSIVFIDEIDAVGKARGGLRNDERESTLNQLLTEMDGFEDSSGVIVIGATNRLEMLDDALLRAGRFDRRVFVSLPTFNERVAIFKVYLEDKLVKVDINELAKMTVGFNGAGISSFVNEAAIYALKRNKEIITMDDFLAVKDKVLFGKKRKFSFSEKEKEILATYQSAKAISAYWLDVDFDKISLISDGFREIDKEIVSKSAMLSKIKVFLAGISVVELIYNETYTNSSEDLAKARLIATDMVERYGMGSKIYPHQMDISRILEEAHEEIKGFLGGMKPIVIKIQKILIEKEVISKDEIKEMVSEVF